MTIFDCKRGVTGLPEFWYPTVHTSWRRLHMLELFDGFLVVDVDAVGVVPVLDEPLAYWVRDSEESYRLVVCAVENCREVHCSLLPGFYFDSSC